MVLSIARSAASNVVVRYHASSPACILLHRQRLQTQEASTLLPLTRYLSSSSRFHYPRKDSQDKDSINPEATEYSKSATDDEGARQDEAAFDPNITDPQEQQAKAGEGRGDKSNPLEVSPANPEVSKQRDPQEGGAQNSGENTRPRSSGGSSPSKGSKIA